MQPFHTKTLIFKVLGVQKWSQNGPQNDLKIELLRGRPPGGPPGAILEAPRGSPEAPGSALGAPGEPQERPRRPKVSSRRPKMSPRRLQEAKKEPHEAPGAAKTVQRSHRQPAGSSGKHRKNLEPPRGHRHAPETNLHHRGATGNHRKTALTTAGPPATHRKAA